MKHDTSSVNATESAALEPVVLAVDPGGVIGAASRLVAGAQVFIYRSLEQARASLDEQSVRAVLLDPNVPGAAQLMGFLRERRDDVARLVVIDAKHMDAARRALESGTIHGYVVQPYTSRLLTAATAAAVAHAHRRRSERTRTPQRLAA